MVDHSDGHTMHRLCSVCTIAGPPEAGETAVLRKLIGDLQDALAQPTRVMAAMANGLWSSHTTPLETASSVDSIPGAVSTLPVLAPGHMASGQHDHEGANGCIMEIGEAIKNPAYRIFQTEYSGCLDISAHA